MNTDYFYISINNYMCGVADYVWVFVFKFKLICSGMLNVKISVITLYIKLITHQL